MSMFYRANAMLSAWQTPTIALGALMLIYTFSGEGSSLFLFVFGLGFGALGVVFMAGAILLQLEHINRSRTLSLTAPVIMLFLALSTYLSLTHATDTLVQPKYHQMVVMLMLAETVLGSLSLPLAMAAVSWGDAHIMAPVGFSAAGDSAPQEGLSYGAQPSSLTFADLYGMDDLKSQLRAAAQKWQDHQGNGILLFGPPGTGKTAFANALAGELRIPIITISFGNLASKWVGETTERFMALIRDARAQAPCVLFMDEIESVLRSRDINTYINDEYIRLVSTFLSEIQNLRQHGGVLYVGATNHLEMLDAAAIRPGRFDFRAEVGLPDTEARRGLIASTLRSKGAQITRDVLDRLAVRWEGFNIPTITQTINAAVEIAQEGGHTGPIPFRNFYAGLRRVQGPKASAPDGSLRLDELALNGDTREQLGSLAHRLRNMDEYEEQGGKIPRGVLLYGPPGTGKTTIARSMALEAGWPLIVRNGKDLVTEDAIADLRKEAGTYRPAIVFIDEADDILGHRANSGPAFKSATNALLTLIDGAGGSLPDVLWIAATNHPDSIDSAALRGGRFETHVYLGPLEEAAVERLVALWLRNNPKAAPDDSAWMMRVVPLLTGMAPADINAVLNAANDAAIDAFLRQKGERAVTVEQVEQALRAMRKE